MTSHQLPSLLQKLLRVSQGIRFQACLWVGLASAVLLAAVSLVYYSETYLPSALLPGSSQWTMVIPGGDTSCAHGDPFFFWFHPGRKDRLLIFFQGGGLCWDGDTCAPGSSYYLDKIAAKNDPNLQGGIFDLKNRDNPFRSYSILYIPYCTGDVHWGNNTVVYTSPGKADEVIQHKGFVNASQALRYAFDQIPSPETVFVTGCSAGSVGSILHTPYIIQHYHKASVIQLGDSLVFDYPQPPELQETYRAQANFPGWIPAMAGMSKDNFSTDSFYIAVANYYPGYRFSQFSYSQDDIQDFFYTVFGGTPGSFAGTLQADMAEIHSNAPNFRYYIAEGQGHCSLPLHEFYSISNNGVQFSDWVADLSRGKDVLNVHQGE